MEVEHTENQVVASVFIKEEPCIEETEDTQYLEEDAPFVINCAIKEELYLEEESDQLVDQYIVPDLNAAIREDVDETENGQHTQKTDFLTCVSNAANGKMMVGAQNCEKHMFNSNDFEINSSYKELFSSSVLPEEQSSLDSKECYQHSVCNKIRNQQNNVSEYKSDLSDIKKYKCDVCNRCFTQPGHLLKHKLCHANIKKYQCNVCNKAFSRSHDASRHKLIHSGIKNYKCDICNKTFTHSGSLSRHKLNHSSVKNDSRKFLCDVCNKVYTRLSALTRHTLIVHSGVKKFQCDVCNKRFTRSDSLSKHKLMHIVN